MAVLFNPEASKRLLDALEAFRPPLGDGLRSAERPPVPKALADEFRSFMERPGSGGGMVPPGCEVVYVPPGLEARAAPAPHAPDAAFVQPSGGIERTGPLEGPRSDLAADGAGGVQGVEKSGSVQGADVQISPMELLQMQFSKSMHGIEMKSLTSIRERAAATIQETLKRNN